MYASTPVIINQVDADVKAPLLVRSSGAVLGMIIAGTGELDAECEDGDDVGYTTNVALI
jgi:hypothetical protein